jgi:HAD superfamily hydrolase (TIGR01509 family)
VTGAQARPAFRPGAVVFDCDGLLLETESRWTLAEEAMFARRGVAFTLELKQQMLGTSREVGSLILAEQLGLPPEDAPSLGAELDERYADALAAHGTEPMPGALDLLHALDPLVPLAVASNNGEAIVRIALELAGISHHFEAVVCAGAEHVGKPSPDVYLAAAAALGVDPALAVALEDSRTGATAAQAAGCFTIGVPSFPGTPLPADAVYGSLTEVGLAELGFL